MHPADVFGEGVVDMKQDFLTQSSTFDYNIILNPIPGQALSIYHTYVCRPRHNLRIEVHVVIHAKLAPIKIHDMKS